MSTRPEVRPAERGRECSCCYEPATRAVEFPYINGGIRHASTIRLCDPCADSLLEQLRYLPNDASAGR